MSKKKDPAPPPPPRRRGGTVLVAGAAAILAAGATFVATRAALVKPSEAVEDLPSVRKQVAEARTRVEQLRAELLQEYFALLTRGVAARDEAAIKSGRDGLRELGPSAIPPCKELAVRTGSDDLRLELVRTLEQFKTAEAAVALGEIVEALPPAHQVVRENAAVGIARMGVRQSAAVLGKLLRAEKDPTMKARLLELYKPYAHADPMGVPDDPAVKQAVARSAAQADLYAEIRALDASKAKDRARLEEIARSDEVAGLRLPALNRIADRKDAPAAALLAELVRAPGKDDGGLVRTNAAVLLSEMPTADALAELGKLLRSEDAALRRPALAAATQSKRREMAALLREFAAGTWPEDERRRAAEAANRLDAKP